MRLSHQAQSLRTHIILGPPQLPDSKRPDPTIPKLDAKQLERIVHPNLCPHREEHLDGLPRLPCVRPGYRLEKLGQAPLGELRERIAVPPDEVLVLGREGVGGRLGEELLRRSPGCGVSTRSAESVMARRRSLHSASPALPAQA